MPPRLRLSLALAVSSVCLLAPLPVSAQADAKPVAEALFQEGRRLVTAGRVAEACPKFAESNRIDPSSGTLLNLASCYEQTGRSASAWAAYKEAQSSAAATGRSDNATTAKNRAEAILPRLARLTIKAPGASPGLVVERDGAPLALAVIDVPLPIDVGEHTVAATAPGKVRWSKTIVVAKDGGSQTVEIPPLDDLPPAAAEPAPKDPPPANETPLFTQKRVGAGIVAIGLVGLGVGGYFGLRARDQRDESKVGCDPVSVNVCNAGGVRRRDDARTSGTVATVAFAAGGAALVTGLIVYVLAPSKQGGSLALTPRISPSGASLEGSF